ncbi:sialic acid-binding Ig-like lectin 11 isoform X2 [Salarias fasciatus]|uniref:sialic acid-binding Ig-like lectin 11 isoform X2 n=1 Tax=Salarias fasciatus TaxID=181472 RepID=UPI001176FBA2|nr:sialic acid-binding Ig-like lectin 11 isoform X2 [Salarias fasciatus]
MFVLIWATLLLCARDSTANTGFTARHAVWYQCQETKDRCGDVDIIFHTNNNNRKGQPGFRGRVSLLEPDVRQRICSIVINDLKESDSGAYQFRVIGTRDSDRYQFLQKVLISVKGLSQKPTVEIPPLTEGREATLTCTAPGLCSGSAPEFLWTWSGAGGSISGNITTLTDRLNAIANRYSSTLTFNPSAEHHGTNITCTVRLTDDRTTEETVTLNVSYVKDLRIIGETAVKEHETLNLTCSVDSFPPSRITWIKLSDLFLQNGTETVVQNDTSAELLNETETSEQEDGDKNSLIISDVTAGDSGQYICNAEHLDQTLTKEINVTVKYRRNPQMAGSTAVNDGDVLNLTCSADSFPPSLIIWTKLGFNTTLQTDSGSASLVIPNVTAEDSGQYVCTAVYLDSAATEYADVTVTYIHKSSGCELRSDVLTCVCISEGFPLPTIKWPTLNSHTEYSIMTTVSNHTVNSTVTLSLKTEGNTTVECVSGNENGELKKTLPVEKKLSGKEDPSIQEVVSLEVIVAFLIGVLLSAIISFLFIKCYRRKQKTSANADETVELVTNNNNPLAVEDDRPYDQEEAHAGTAAAEKTAAELDSESKDVEYANIDFSLLKRKTPLDEARTDESTKTEYAEIKKEVIEEREDDGREESEMLEREEEVEAKEGEEEAAEMEAVYSNVKEVMNEI